MPLAGRSPVLPVSERFKRLVQFLAVHMLCHRPLFRILYRVGSLFFDTGAQDYLLCLFRHVSLSAVRAKPVAARHAYACSAGR